ncbi:large ribosomal subunit protein eL34-like [Convolutriloba macropyga]|uniref:large ribosomal subunit protein eL34-like n=1 Tax=Convolutriloba macropyga TaxID=536237 RepID=UPI003F51C0F3
MVQRLCYRRQNTYNTKSNKRRLVKTPGNKLVYLHRNKMGRVPRCAATKQKLHGIKPARPGEKSRIAKKHRTISRPYGGVLCCRAVQNKILRAYLQEEMKNVKKYLQAKKKK